MSDRFKPGSRPPYISLAEALRLATQIYEQGGGRASKDLMSRLTGNTSSSSSFVRKVNALKSYGLAVEDNGDVILSNAGVAAVAPTEPHLAAEAKKVSFQQIDVFNRVYERHKGKILPADEFLKNMLEQDSGIPRELTSEWISALKDGLKTAGLLHDRGDGKMQIMESPIVQYPRGSEAANNQTAPAESPANKPAVTSDVLPKAESQPGLAGGHSTRIQLSGQRFAVFSIPDVLTSGDAKKLRAAISGLTSIIDSMVQEDSN
jgi:hypothetical protein